MPIEFAPWLVQRKKGFKKSIDQDDARRRREEMQIQIRKNKREESVNQRRRIGTLSLYYQQYHLLHLKGMMVDVMKPNGGRLSLPLCLL